MADIVERLRGLADLFEAGDAPRHVVLHMRAGADEIKRLRAVIERVYQSSNQPHIIEMTRAALEGK